MIGNQGEVVSLLPQIMQNKRPIGIITVGPGISIWLPGLVSQSAILWYETRIEMKRVAKGHIKLSSLHKT
ncbi:MAG: hypothetical protein A2509_06030 [Candidatus Edwardsbacteria bacterium RIFOXYD12_FULL_50_11]|uniref:Uncharacterized protein n=1 Tax=Candidatus Edwardsbacteria bacterium GWF2_54_11 TaxID=1817851 RepID=A0A1F5R4D6_9BACT|nr:MAG: hypothetical protein A2502_10585 [Candidatus Edwardsbacteria bacterium RifOxyC12_full_54_24]OGF06722.1 MAG: hypothetical protein A2273_00480 [Candidatus Edwardsbacteria bacterium RifOxyA12_full_54_48]OGF08791.1 MAG: hypothetical protein A2024_00735 [Candidatus Edwardsbacteria bacterium GWF2_54_11]OGF10673.1 MAG: hypothetical protein A3K15_05845 [Candidatus Edwardsbacteria bacterium GWE2_54_12]OGF15454.1 MAG: hypothetical protein A2509_06030 [Candidatus Edwardsbacteria bacterium RIFOXYD1